MSATEAFPLTTTFEAPKFTSASVTPSIRFILFSNVCAQFVQETPCTRYVCCSLDMDRMLLHVMESLLDDLMNMFVCKRIINKLAIFAKVRYSGFIKLS